MPKPNNQKFKIEISAPCLQRWQDMEPALNGRYCNDCSKIVTDFTGMSNQEIINLIAGRGNMCGKIADWQLNSINRQLAERSCSGLSRKLWRLAATLLFSFYVFNAPAQTPRKMKKHYPNHVTVKRRPYLKEDLTAFYLGYQPQQIGSPALEIKSVSVDPAVGGFMTTVGGIAVVSRQEPPMFFKDGSYQRIYDLLQSVIRQTF